MAKNSARKLLDNVVIGNSQASDWKDAVTEWEIIDWKEDLSQKSRCICGQCGLKHLFTIRNVKTNFVLFPIGSSCIEKFGRKDLIVQAKNIIELYNLLNAIKGNKFITLSDKYFSKKVLKILYEYGAFKPTNYNSNDGENDYDFLIKMFGKSKWEITDKQQKKINGLIAFSILPFLKETLRIE